MIGSLIYIAKDYAVRKEAKQPRDWKPGIPRTIADFVGKKTRPIKDKMAPGHSPCASCKLLRRRCAKDCNFAPYFPYDDPHKFDVIHKVLNASNVGKMLQVDNQNSRSMLELVIKEGKDGDIIKEDESSPEELRGDSSADEDEFLLEKWLSFSQGLRNANHIQTLNLADNYGRFVYEDNLISWRYLESKKALITAPSTTPISTAFFSNNILAVGKNHARNGELIDITMRKRYIREPIWYLDSGCSRSMTGVKSYLHKYVEKPGPKVVFGDNSSCITEGYGSINCGVLRRNDVYVLDMSSLSQNGACFFDKAFESVNWLWHKRLSHLNFKNINKPAIQNKVLGLPSLVYSKDEPFKQIRTDNGTEFRNSELDSFCDEKGISHNFFSPYTSEQNGVAEKNNRTLFEAAKKH
ncbi:retrovirus-related pol polyprotein from transposon TNT 1-94 [Tanacetum coccineum]